eukprot:13031448-Alexandrium_andersonii.AAC.1
MALRHPARASAAMLHPSQGAGANLPLSLPGVGELGIASQGLPRDLAPRDKSADSSKILLTLRR